MEGGTKIELPHFKHPAKPAPCSHGAKAQRDNRAARALSGLRVLGLLRAIVMEFLYLVNNEG